MMGCWCQLPPQNWHRPGWMTVLLLMTGSCLLFPVFKSILCQIHAAVTGGYISGSHSLAFINCPNDQIAKDIARGILEKKLAASVNIMPKSSSLYIWKGEIEESTEVLLRVEFCVLFKHSFTCLGTNLKKELSLHMIGHFEENPG
ncbi:PREDICTED: protein CutA homolog [Nanorana parkeri]|uniref:protein CutA homolog n=1 Tax=Nanorana parkeri TaxID=125878 RepID=UPI000854369C|nr:PREDICTED: protein CutA homolog [Nanorana parkeri]